MQVQTRRRSAPMDPAAGAHSTPPATSPGVYRSATVGGARPSPAPARPAKRRGRRSPLWAKLCVILGALVMMGSGGAIVGSKVLISQATGSITQSNLLGDAKKATEPGGHALKGPVNLLLLGLDARKRWAVNDTRSDTIIVLHIAASLDQAYLMSIPRDTQAFIPADPATGYPGGTDKINAAFYFGARNGGGWAGGAQLMAKTVKKLTGLSFDGAAIIDFSGFKGVIDALGSVHMCVDHEVKSKHMEYVDGKPMWISEARKLSGTKKPVVHKVGCREMEGWEALDYSRQRYGLPNGDYDRQRHQQQLIKAMAKKASSSGVITNPLKISRLLKAAGKSFILDTGGVAVDDFIFTLKGIAANDLVLLRTNNGTFSGNGEGREQLNELSKEMFKAAAGDTLGEFVVDNPAVIVKS